MNTPLPLRPRRRALVLRWLSIEPHLQRPSWFSAWCAASLVVVAFLGSPALSRAAAADRNPADELPPHIRRLTWFGERADWALDGTRILFLAKTFGDVYEVEVATGRIRPVTHHFRHHGFTRALYLSNSDILLSGPRQLDPLKPGDARTQCWLSVLARTLDRPPVPLETKCSEGPAVSRRRLHLAWTHVAAQYPEQLAAGTSRILEADLEYGPSGPRLGRQRIALESTNLPFRCTLETQNFVPPAESSLTFSTYGYQGTDVGLLDLATGRVRNLTNSPEEYDEPEGVFPDGRYTLVECDRSNRKGWQFIDLWKLALDGAGYVERLTHFSDYAGWKASNPVVSDNGRWIAFQLAKSSDEAGVGYGIFVLDLEARPKPEAPARHGAGSP